jgi:Protein of unknown function (DUF3604)
VSRDYMARYQTLVEVYQHKGASECVPGTTLGDPSCAFEQIADQTDPAGYVRDALGRGLALAATTGQNPIALGFIGSTDTHNGAPGSTREQGWNSHLGGTDDTPDERLDQAGFSPGGLAAVWAEENTREAIFAGLKRRETYATSGTRIAVRTYALAGVASAAAAQRYCDDPRFPQQLIAAGAQPMGGTLSGAAAPYLFVAAMADRTPLASFDLVRIRADAGVPSTSIHAETLPANTGAFCRFWRDPGFARNRLALYYARVFEQPTRRWSSHDCAASPTSAACSDSSVAQTITERAWTSPIYVTP